MVRRSLSEIDVPAARSENLMDINEALAALTAQDSTTAEIVRLRFFMGMTIQEAADTVGTSVRTANRLWKFGRAFLERELRDSDD